MRVVAVEHFLEGEVERLKARDGRLGEVVAVQLAHGQAYIALGVTQLDPLLLEHLGEGFQLLQVSRLVWWEVKSLGRKIPPTKCLVLGDRHRGWWEVERVVGEWERREMVVVGDRCLVFWLLRDPL